MGETKYIFFDCMETLVDMTVLPGVREYAQWAYAGSGLEDFWPGFTEFFSEFIAAREFLTAQFPPYKEFAMLTLFKNLASLKSSPDQSALAACLDKKFWETYLSQCYVREEVREIVSQLSADYKLGIVSNFKVPNGIETLIQANGLSCYFEFIVTSIQVGWKKPHNQIFTEAIHKSGVNKEEIVFIGDNYACDYIGPRQAGMRSVLLDRNNCFPQLAHRVKNFHELIDNNTGRLKRYIGDKNSSDLI